MWLLQCCLLLQALFCRAAYYHELSMTTIAPPEPLEKDSFFGYSVAFLNNSVIASAPRADKEGQVFSCDLGNRNCTRMNIKIAGTRKEWVCPPEHHCEYRYHRHHFWLGATVKADNNSVIVCAPRVTSIVQGQFPGEDVFKMYGTNGLCYINDKNDMSVNTHFSKISQVSDDDRSINITAYENVTDAFGWSMDIDMNGLVRVGSPAPAAGRMLTYNDVRAKSSAPPILWTSPYPGGFNFGYSIATGVFITSDIKDVKPGVAIGTPYGENGTGLVLFYDDKKKLQHIVKDPAGVGSMFSAALCAAKLDGTTTSLLVGAPAHFTGKNYHTGIVYVYRRDNEKNSMTNVSVIEGPKQDGAFFGYAIVNVGDMDQDGKDEIAIAAPYEDEGKGAVYLYAGSSLSDGKTDIKWVQRFQPKDPKFQNIGLSLVADKYLGNGCNGLAIGAPGNDTVAVYHCLTLITVDVQTTVPNLQNRGNKTNGFAFQLCLKAVYPPKSDNISAEFKVRVKITHPNATLTDAKGSNDYIDYVEKLDNIEKLDKIENPNGCRYINVTISESGDYDQEIQFNITAKLLNNPMYSEEFSSSRASVSAHSNLTSSMSVRAAECKEEPCAPELTVKLTKNVTSPYQIGSTKTVNISVTVSNGEADTAYRPCVRVRAANATVDRAPSNCTFVDDSQRICQLQRPLKANADWEVTLSQNIELGLTSLTSKSEQIQVYAEVFNRCELSKKPDDNDTITLNLTTDASGLRLASKTDLGQEVPFNRHDVKLGKTLRHTYTITNKGEINWVNISSDIRLYKQPYIMYNNSIEVYSRGSLRSLCEVKEHTDTSSGSGNFTGVSCSLGHLRRKEAIVVIIQITVLPGALEKVFEKSNGTAETFLRIHAESHERELKELTTLVLQDATVPAWVIAVATIVGVIIVILMAFALRECGLLRRKTKEKLENLQKEVKRKSMMLQRQSMRLTESARAELSKLTYRELLDAAEIKDAEEARESIVDRRINVEDTPKKGKGPTTALNGNSSVSNLDLRALIEQSLQKQNPKAQSSKADKIPQYDESEI